MSVSPVELQQALAGASYPCGKHDLLARASTNDAGSEVKKALNALPDRRYDGPDEVSAAVAGGS